MPDDQDLPVTAASITLTTPAEQVRDTVILQAEARLALVVELADGTEVGYHPAAALPARALDAGERAVLDAYGELPSLALLIRQSAAAFHLWQTAGAIRNAAPSGAWRPWSRPTSCRRRWRWTWRRCATAAILVRRPSAWR
ncbi:hypothetical protein [Kitasatospora sp. NPDC127060]|uniref:hypothetical protein n=1 Tax=Kitasatospora sp. NPDC127060 TaxID=3347121 RepID=UPI003668E5CE